MFYSTVSLSNLSINNVEKIIDLIDKVNVSYGVSLVSKFPNVRSSFGPQYTVSNGYWKHSNCKSISDENR